MLNGSASGLFAVVGMTVVAAPGSAFLLACALAGLGPLWRLQSRRLGVRF
jgi:hypothetical protein